MLEPPPPPSLWPLLLASLATLETARGWYNCSPRKEFMICIAVLPRGGLSETQNLVFDLFVSDQLPSSDSSLEWPLIGVTV